MSIRCGSVACELDEMFGVGRGTHTYRGGKEGGGRVRGGREEKGGEREREVERVRGKKSEGREREGGGRMREESRKREKGYKYIMSFTIHITQLQYVIDCLCSS